MKASSLQPLGHKWLDSTASKFTRLQVPLTLDRETVNILLLEAFIGLAGEKTAIGDAITLAVKRIYDQGGEGGEQVLILLTDGANTAGEIDPLKAAELAQQIGA